MGVEEEHAEPVVGEGDRLHQRHLGLAEAGLAEEQREEQVLQRDAGQALAAAGLGHPAEGEQALLSRPRREVRRRGRHDPARAGDVGGVVVLGGRLEQAGDLLGGHPGVPARHEEPGLEAAVELAPVEPVVRTNAGDSEVEADGPEVVVAGPRLQGGEDLVQQHPGPVLIACAGADEQLHGEDRLGARGEFAHRGLHVGDAVGALLLVVLPLPGAAALVALHLGGDLGHDGAEVEAEPVGALLRHAGYGRTVRGVAAGLGEQTPTAAADPVRGDGNEVQHDVGALAEILADVGDRVGQGFERVRGERHFAQGEVVR